MYKSIRNLLACAKTFIDSLMINNKFDSSFEDADNRSQCRDVLLSLSLSLPSLKTSRGYEIRKIKGTRGGNSVKPWPIKRLKIMSVCRDQPIENREHVGA